ncbi:hypothetical protein C492_21370 [Natronococcus jeotgali DSM 18795]|uniref:Uncharacterized protein n=1 Tax=Natronococcus jeotgali DSM 18795 TaxID=1227498 RepID=L9WPA9_9EURY|nr:hypothetical protein C492_21370 [Natronococcus jeotgali DSM 18795]
MSPDSDGGSPRRGASKAGRRLLSASRFAAFSRPATHRRRERRLRRPLLENERSERTGWFGAELEGRRARTARTSRRQKPTYGVRITTLN